MPMKPGQDSRVDYEYIRHGVVNIFMANEPLKGTRMVEVTEFKTKKDWAKFIKRIADEMHPEAKKITLVMDNFNTHNASAFYENFEPEEAKRLWDRFEFIYTPKHGSCGAARAVEHGRDRITRIKWAMPEQTYRYDR